MAIKIRYITLLAASVAVLVFLLGSYLAQPPYTARVVDAETGEPVEGAVYLAVWWKTVSGKKAWFEGASTEMAKFVEGYSDKDGLIRVPGYWWRIPVFGRERSLTVYKPGYVLWNSEYRFPVFMKRDVPAPQENTVPLEKWNVDYSYGEHSMFLTNTTKGCLTDELYLQGTKLLATHFKKYELMPYRQEHIERSKPR